MKEVIINQCDFCKKVSFNKSSIRKHEKLCFFDPATRSCATCLWFSPLYFFHEFDSYPIQCYLKLIIEVPEGTRMKLKTQCESWMDHEIYDNNETCDNEDEMEERLLLGQVDYFQTLKKHNKGGAISEFNSLVVK